MTEDNMPKTVLITRIRGGYLVKPWYENSPEVAMSLAEVERKVRESFTLSDRQTEVSA